MGYCQKGELTINVRVIIILSARVWCETLSHDLRSNAMNNLEIDLHMISEMAIDNQAQNKKFQIFLQTCDS